MQSTDTDIATRQLVTFRIEDAWLCTDVDRVQEVLRTPEMTRVPLASEAIQGLINLRGQIVTSVDVRQCLGMAQRPDDVDPMSVMMHTADGAVSYLVDQIGDVLRVEESLFEEPPETLDPAVRHFINGAFKLEDRLLLEIDGERILESIELQGET